MQHLEQLLPLAALLHGGFFFYVTLVLTRDFGFCGVIRGATPFSRLSRQAKNTGDLFECVVCDLLYEPKFPGELVKLFIRIAKIICILKFPIFIIKIPICT